MAARRDAPTFDYGDLIAERTRDFTGRDWLFQAIDDWLADSDGSRFFLLTGEPGSGKSAVAARLLQFSQGNTAPPPDVSAIGPDFLSAVHFCSARDRRWINPLAFSESLALQLAARYPAFAKALVERQADRAIQMDVRQTVDRVEGGRVTGIGIKNLHLGRLSPEDAFLRVVREPLEALFEDGTEASIVILVDALDESLLYAGGDGIVPLLAQADFMPAGVRFLFTTRPDERVLNHFLDATELNISAAERSRQNRADVTAFIRRSLEEKPALSGAAAELEPAQRENLVESVADRADGNFLYVRFLLDEAEQGYRSLADVEGMPRGLDGLYFQSLYRVVKVGQGRWQDDYAPLIGILSVAQESLSEAQLEAFTGRSDVWRLLGDLGQFIDTVPPESEGEDFRYRVYHQSVADFLGRRHIQPDSRSLRNSYYLPPEPWHRRIADHYWQRHRDGWSGCDPYGLNNLAAHLYRGQQFDRLASLIDQEWMAARFEHGDYTYDGFLADLDLAWERAHKEAHRQAHAGEEPAALVDCIRYALIQTSINALSANYIPELVARAVETGLWSGRRAMSVAGRVSEATKNRAKMYAGLLDSGRLDPDLYTVALEQGLEAALSVGDGRSRAEVLAALAPHLQGQALEWALQAALWVTDKESRAEVLAALAPQLEVQALERGLEAAEYEGYHAQYLAEILTALAPHLEGQTRAHALERALEAALAIEHDKGQAHALAALTPHLQGRALERALEVVLAIEDEDYRARALAAMAPQLEGQALERALEAALAIEDDKWQAYALGALAPHLEGQALERALEAALAIEHDKLQAYALAAMVPQLEGQAQAEALKRGLAAALAPEYERYETGYLAEVLTALAPHLEGQARADALERALWAAVYIEDEGARAEVLTALAPHLEGRARAEALERGLAAAVYVEDEGARAEALAALAPHLEGQALERGLEAAVGAADERSRVEALAALAPHLEGQARARALERGLALALAIKGNQARVQALAALAPHLEGRARAHALERGLEAALTIEHPGFARYYRAEALAALAPHLEGQALERGLEAALTIEDERSRVEALAALAPQLQGQARAEALERGLEAALTIEDEGSRAEALAALALHLEGRALERGLEAALTIEDERSRVEALAALAPQLQGQVRAEALERGLGAALRVADERSRVEALAALAPQLQGQARARAFERALALALAIKGNRSRVQALAALVPHLEGRARAQALEQGLKAALAIEEALFFFPTNDRMEALALLAPHLEGQALERGLDAALAIPAAGPRAKVLAALVPQLEGKARAEALERGLEAALAIEYEWDFAENRSVALAALAPHLEGRALERGLEAALSIEREWDRAHALAALAPHLEGRLLERGLEAALSVEGEWHRVPILAALAPRLEGRALQRSLDAALAVVGEEYRAEALTALTPYLEGKALERGLETALAIEPAGVRAKLLLVFLTLVPDPEPVLAAIRTAVTDHLRHNLAQAARNAVLNFIAEPGLFAPPIFSESTLADIADKIIEVTTEWRWL